MEVGVASTKAFTCQLTVLAVLALKAALDRGRIDAAGLATHLEALRALPGLMNHAMGLSSDIAAVAEQLAEAQDILFLGRGPMFPLALEGALKLKEISYIHAEGYASGELKHGPIALIDNRVPVIVLAPRDGLFDKTVSNMQEVMARNGKVLLLSDAGGVEGAGQGGDVLLESFIGHHTPGTTAGFVGLTLEQFKIERSSCSQGAHPKHSARRFLNLE
mgnify:CR=1 FL=1